MVDVVQHLRDNIDHLGNCVLGFSGGKESVALAWAIRQVRDDVPFVYAHCPELEWPEHADYVAGWGAEFLDTGHGVEWFSRNKWAFLHCDSKAAERFARVHHRGCLRRYAKQKGKILLWGNTIADRNIVPNTRYATKDGCELWMPLRDLPYKEIAKVIYSIPQKYSPSYLIPTVSATGYICSRVKDGLQRSRRDEVAKRMPRHVVDWFDIMLHEKENAPV